MNPFKLGELFFDKVTSPLERFFATDMHTFGTLLLSSIALFYFGFTDIAIIVSIYNTIFGHAYISEQSGDGSSSNGDQGDKQVNEIMQYMGEATEALEEVKGEVDN